jgi:hypothetical protein
MPMSRVRGLSVVLAAGLLPAISAVWAQNPADLFGKAPPDVDNALRARIAHFYQAHVDGKPRKADEVVAEDSKDFFFAGNKPKYLSFEILKITYSEGFTRALATVGCETYVMMPGFAGKPVKLAGASKWKIVDGQWFWYVEEEGKGTVTPFGVMKADPASAGAAPRGLPDLASGPTAASLRDQVKIDKEAVHFIALREGSEEIRIKNNLPGPITLKMRHGRMEGVTVSLDRTEVKGGETAVIGVKAAANALIPAVAEKIVIDVEPVGRQFAVDVIFDPAR